MADIPLQNGNGEFKARTEQILENILNGQGRIESALKEHITQDEKHRDQEDARRREMWIEINSTKQDVASLKSWERIGWTCLSIVSGGIGTMLGILVTKTFTN